MPKGVLFDNIKYLSSKEAGSYAGYTHDYISRLARNGRIPGRKVSRVWYVEAGPFLSFLVKHKHKKTHDHKSLSKELKKEYKSVIKREDINGVTPFTLPTIPPFPSIELPEKFLQKSFAFVFAITLVFGTYLTKDTSYVHETYNTSYVYVSGVRENIQLISNGVLDTSVLLSRRTSAIAFNALKGKYNNEVQEMFTYKNITQKISNTITVANYVIEDGLSAYLSIIKRTGEAIIVSADEIYTTSKDVRWSTIKNLIKDSLFTTRLYAKDKIIKTVQEVGSTIKGITIDSKNTLAAVNISELIGGFIDNTVSKVISFFVPNEDDYIFLTAFKEGKTSLGHEVATTLPSPKDKQVDIPSVSNDIASNTPQNTNTKVVIERVIKSGVTESYVLDHLEQLNNKLKSEIYKLSSKNVTKIINNYSTISKMNKIDKLKGITINSSTFTDGTINGSTSFSGTTGSFSGALSAGSFSISGNFTVNTSGLVYDSSTSNIGIGTTSPYQKLSVAGNVIADTFIATSTTATSTFAGGLAIETSGFVYDYSTNRVGIGTDTPLYTLDVLGTTRTTGLSITEGGFISQASSTISSGGLTTIGYSTTSQALIVQGTSATSTFAGGLAIETSGFVYDYSTNRVGIGTTSPSQRLSVSGSGYITGGLGIGVATTTSGVLETSGDVRVGGNLTVIGDSTVLGGSISDTLTINSAINSNLIPDINAVRDLGSPSYYWDNAYVDTLTANNISAASTTIAGTKSSTFTLNSDNSSFDIEDMNLIFFRGTVVPNALLSWNSTLDKFDFNQPLFIQNDSSTTTVVSLNVLGTSGQTSDIFRVSSSTGTSFFNVTKGGNVGIGTTSPYRKLSVSGSGVFSGGDILSSTLTATSTATAANFVASSASATSTFSGGLAIETSGFVYDYSTGNVGIGTASPTQALDIGSGNIITTGTLGAGVATLSSGSTIGNLTFANGSITDSSGAISFGNENLTTTGTLSASGQVTFANTVSGILAVDGSGVLSATTSVAASNIEDKFLRNDANDTTTGQLTAVNLVASSASATSTLAGGLAIETSGFVYDYSTNRVGIGTASPNQKLNVYGGSLQMDLITSAQNITLHRADTPLNDAVMTLTGAGGGTFGIAVGGVTLFNLTNDHLTLGSELAIGHQEKGRLTLPNNTYIGGYNAAGSNDFYIIGIDSNDKVNFSNSQMIIDPSTGNVGIGTTSPYAKLSVVGETVSEYFTATSTTATSTLAGGLAVTGGQLALENGDYLTNTTDGLITLYGTSTATGYGNSLDFDLGSSASNKWYPVISSPAGSIKFGSSLIINNDKQFVFGGESGTAIVYRTGGSRALNIETSVNGTLNTSGYIIIGKKGDGRTASNNTLNPTLRIFSSDYTQANDYLELYHDQTDANLAWGNGNLSIGNGIATTTIDSSGNVGIGTTSPYAKLSVVGETVSEYFTATSTTATSTISAGLTLSQTPGDYRAGPTLAFGNGDTGFYENTDDLIRISIAGTPTYEISSTGLYANKVKGGSIFAQTSSATTPGLGFLDDNNTGIGTAGNDILSLITGGIEAIRIDSSQNIGIGTTSPYQKLSVAGNVIADTFIATSTTATSTFAGPVSISKGFSPTALGLYFGSDTDTGIWSSFDNSINFTTGGTNRLQLSTVGVDIIMSGNAAAPSLIIGNDVDTGLFKPATNELGFTTGGVEGLRIDSSGKVGIGDTSPASLLTVGSGDLFQVNSSGAIASATGITSSGTITFSGLTVSRSVFTNSSGNLTSSSASSVLANSITDETGSGVLVFATSPTLTTPTLGVAQATSIGVSDITKVTATISDNNIFNIPNTGAGKYIAYSPIPKILWHDRLAFSKSFGEPAFEVYNGSAWSSGTLDTGLFSQQENRTSQQIDGVTNTSARWTWNSSNISYSMIDTWIIGVTYVSVISNKDFLIESSSDGSTWSTIHTSTGNTANANPVLLESGYLGADSYLRLTITVTNGQPLKLSSIRALTSRWGNQGGGSEQEYPYVWNSSQNIAFGANSAAANGVVTVGTNTTSASGGVYFGTDTNLYRSGANQLKTDDELLVTNNLGIGTTSPLAKLEVNGDFRVGEGSNYNGLFVDATNGRVGIGTASPEVALTIDGVSSDTAGSGILTIRNTANTQQAWSFRMSSSDDSYLILDGKDVGAWQTPPIMAWNRKNGNVGIGTTSPLAKLEVNGDFRVGEGSNYNGLFVDATNGIVGIGTANPSSATKLHIKSSGVSRLFVESTGNQASLDLKSNAANWRVMAQSMWPDGAESLTFYDVNAAKHRFSIDSSGNIGVGTTTPGAKLDVYNGAFCVDDSSPTCGNASRTAGTIYAVATSITGIDLAEQYPTKDATLSAGELVVFDQNNEEFVSKASSQDTQFLGVISTTPGILLGGYDAVNFVNEIKVPVTLSGRVPVKINHDGGDITVGDRLTVSTSTPGVAMKAISSGRTIGVALENYTATSTKDSITVFIDPQYSFIANQFTINSSGNIGIGTTNPEYKLHVIGDIAATSFVNISTRTAKKDISYISNEDDVDILKKLKDIKIARYRYKIESDNNPLRLGLIAEESPSEVLSVSGKGVDIYKLSTFTIAGVQALAGKLDNIEVRLEKLETGGLNNSGGVSTSKIIDYLTSLGSDIKDGIAVFKNVVTKALTIGSSDKPSGITLYDEVTSKPYCIKMSAGVLVSTLGECSTIPTTTSTTTPPTTNSDTTPPIITITGNNPANIDVNSSYVDLGAIVTDNVNDNLGISYKVNGTTVSNINLDTSTDTTYTITYSATDQVGNTGTATRTVIVGTGVTATTTQSTTTTTATTTPDTTTSTATTTSTSTASTTTTGTATTTVTY